MIAVAEARRRILAGIEPVSAEQVALDAAVGRTLAEPVIARTTQPPHAVSAMDGYAVRAADVADVPARLRVIGTAPAGQPFPGVVEAGQAVRIFTGGELPRGADTVVIQENTQQAAGLVEVRVASQRGSYVRPAGLDFRCGDPLLSQGCVLTARDIGLAAAMNWPWLPVRRKPRVALLATGNEIVQPGEPLEIGQIVSSNSWALSAFLRLAGAEPINLGIAADDLQTLRKMATAARGSDLFVTSGGASVGEHDLVRQALTEVGFALDFWRIAMRPGKPLMFGRLGSLPVLGLPGNPVSALVCAVLFLAPVVAALLARNSCEPPQGRARLGRALAPNDSREDYLRATLAPGAEGLPIATPYEVQDSSMLSLLATAGCLVVRPPFAPAVDAGSVVDIVPLISSPAY
jgi:molybdopterin molybdotransferase